MTDMAQHAGSRMRVGWLVGALLGSTALMSLAALPVQAQTAPATQVQARSFSIAAQPLAAALRQFSEQSGLQFAYSSEEVQGLTSPGVSGSHTPDAALNQLLQNTGVIWRYTAQNTISVVRVPQSGQAVLPPVTVQGNATPAETAWSPVQGYLATRSATATKTDTPILQTPASIQVIPRQVFEEQKALNLKDIYENISGVQQSGNTLNAQSEVLPNIRGFESPVLLRNGLRSTQVGSVDLANIERVEVLKGPASILYGTLQPGGIVNYVTKRPQDTESHTVEQQIGSYDLYRTTADSTGRLTENGSLLYRMNLAYTNSGSFRDFVDVERKAFAPSLLWRPGDRTEMLVDVSYLHETQPYDTGVPLGTNGKPLVDKSTFFNDPNLDGRDLQDFAASYQLSHEFNSIWSLRNQLLFHRAENKNESLRPRGITADNQQLTMRYQNEDRRDDEVQAVLDATAKFATGAIDHALLLGGDVNFQETDFRRFRVNSSNINISSDPAVGYTPPGVQPKEVTLSKTRWVGLYAQDQISLLEDGRLKFLLGGRYDAVHQENRVDNTISPDVNDRAFTGRTALLYELTKQYSTYVSVSQSFRPQSPGTLDVNRQALDPEEGLQYETGIKGSFFDDRLSATASIFEIEKSNVAVFDQALFNATGQSASFPGVRQRSRGFEFDLIGALTPQINVVANYSYTDTRVLQNDGDRATVGGPLGGVPTNMARLWATYDFDASSSLAGFGFGAGARYVDSSTPQFLTSVTLAPYTVFDVGAWYRWNAVKAGISIQNLFDHDYIVRASDRAIAHPGEPLTAIASLSVQF